MIAKWSTVDKEKLEAEIDKLDAKIEAATRGRQRVSGDEAIAIVKLVATRDAICHVFNCLV